MGRLRFGSSALIVGLISLCTVFGCGGHKPTGVSPYPARITLTPSAPTSLQVGTTMNFLATAANGTGNSVSVTLTYQSSDTSILNMSPVGAACAGHWDSTYTVCTAGAIGVAQVTATSLGAHSAPTYVFVHPEIDNIVVTSTFQQPTQAVQEPCLGQGQSMTVLAQAFSQGVDITQDVGPFIWSADNTNVVTLKPIVTNLTYNVATNEAIATANTPGLSQIYASAEGVTSTSFQQPQLLDASNNPIPVVFDFFETCPIQNIALEVGPVGSQQTNQISFVASKGTSTENVNAVVTDVMGNSSLVGSDTPVILSKIPLTWSASNPAAVGVGSGCTLNCALTTPSPGAGSVTASCSPPTCNIGFPMLPAAFATPAALAQCATFFPPSCQQYIPVPVYASARQLPGQPAPSGPGSISGLVTGATSAPTVLATSDGCQFTNPLDCTTSLYNVTISKNVAGNENPLPSSPTSLLFDPAGDKAFMGSEVAAATINPSSLGGTTSAFTPVGAATGDVLAVSNNGNFAVYSDTTIHPNQVFIVNTAPLAGVPGVTPLNITGATTAGFSPDNLKAFIFGTNSAGTPNLYVYSTVQGFQTACWNSTPGTCAAMPTGTSINSIAFSNSGAFTYAVEPSSPAGPAVTVFNTCNNLIATDTLGAAQTFPLSASPIAFNALPDGQHFIALEAGGAIDYITATVTAASVPALCPMSVSHAVQHLSLNQGTITPINFFMSPDGSLLYVVASDRASVLVYNFGTGTTNGIELVGGALPIRAGISADAGTIIIAATDGMLHSVSTAIGGADLSQTPFPNLPDYLNAFCTFTPTPAGPCTLNLIAVRP